MALATHINTSTLYKSIRLHIYIPTHYNQVHNKGDRVSWPMSDRLSLNP
ncbi:MAG: hypothetical protein V7K86_12470 [Nostoc sp.]